MRNLFKLAVPAVIIIVLSLFYKGEIVTHLNTLNQQRQENKLAMKAFYLAMELQTVSSLQNFIDSYPAYPHIDLVKLALERLQYNEAEDKNTIDAYSLYLNKFSESNFAEEISYKRAVLINIIVGYESYLVQYPQGRWRKSALYKRARIIDVLEEKNLLANIYPVNNSFIYANNKQAPAAENTEILNE